GDGAGDAAALVADGGGGDERPHGRAVPPAEEEVVLLLHAAAAALGVEVGQGAVGARRVVHELADGPAEHLVGGVAEHLGHAGVDEGGAPGGGGGPDALVGGLDDQAVAGLALAEGVLSAALLGNVADDGEDLVLAAGGDADLPEARRVVGAGAVGVRLDAAG